MVGRIIGTIVLILILALIYLAPQGLLTKPTLEEMSAGPFQLRDLETVTMSEATNRIIDLAFEDSLLQAGWLPCLINEQLVSSVESVQVGLFCENRASGESDTIVDGDEDVHWPEEEYLIASFPYRGKHSLMLGSWKVYRGLLHEILKRRLAPGAVLEVFDTNAEQIRYLMPVE